MARTDAEILGREDVDDLDAILAVTNTDVEEALHAVEDNAEDIFTWDYERSRPALGKLYEKAKSSQWNGDTDLPWETEVDPERDIATSPMTPTVAGLASVGIDLSGTALASWDDVQWRGRARPRQNRALRTHL